ncbi:MULTISPECIES: Ig-like domain-containing protein [Bhargavaea]|uniref:Ig-like domain-containing protein n=1 Tax=Bhargavaea changchunensis TaxID=2134037 RepID=A0ABW2NFE6_9BACL|nr:Ig-like domain-containing protein [Bhargavaea sp. CC-171006]
MNPLNRKKRGNPIRKTIATAGIAAALVFSTIPFGAAPARTFAEQPESALQLTANVRDEGDHYKLDLSLAGPANDNEGSAQAVVFYAPFLSDKWQEHGTVTTTIEPSSIAMSQLTELESELKPIRDKVGDVIGQLEMKLASDIEDTGNMKVSDVIAVEGMPAIEAAVTQLEDPNEKLASLPVFEGDVEISFDEEISGAFIANFMEDSKGSDDFIGLYTHLESEIEKVVLDSVEGVRSSMEGLAVSEKEQQDPEEAAAPITDSNLLIDEIISEIIEPGKAELNKLIEEFRTGIEEKDSKWTTSLEGLPKVNSIHAETTLRIEKPVRADNTVIIQAALTNVKPNEQELKHSEIKAEADFGEESDPVKIPKGPSSIYLFGGDQFAFGEGLVGATVFARSEGGDHIGHAVVEPPFVYFADEIIIENNGFFGMELQRPLEPGEVIEFYQQTEDGQRSESVYVEVLPAPDGGDFEPTLELPVVDDIYDIDYVVTGTAGPGNLVAAVTEEDLVGIAEVMEDGSFLMELEAPLEAGTEVGFIQVNEAEEYSDFTFKTVLKAEMSLDAPTVDPIDDDDLGITGAAGAGNVVLAGVGEELIGVADVDEDGRFVIELAEPLQAGTVVELLQVSEDGQYSDTVQVTVQKAGDAVVQKPTVQRITDKDRTVTGKGLPGHTVLGYLDNEEIGKAEVDEDGKFSMKLENPFTAGTVLEFRQANADGKLSEPVQVTVEKAETSGTGSDHKAESGTKGTSGTSGSSSGQKLPKTATATGALGLAGGGVLLAGLLMRRFSRKGRNVQ